MYSLGLLFLILFALPARAGQRDLAPRGAHGPEPPPAMRAEDDDRLLLPLDAEAAPRDPRDGRRRDGAAIDEPSLEFARRALASKTPSPVIGGDDIYVHPLDYLDDVEIDIADDGTIYMAIGFNPSAPDPEYIYVYRSLDGGNSFDWVYGTPFVTGEYDRLYDINVFEGTQDKVFLTYMHWNSTRGRFDMRVSWAPLTAGLMTWSTRTVMNTPGVSFLGPDLAADDLAFAAYYLYAVCAGLDGNGDDIWFSRSTDYGDTWSAPYRIAELISSGNLMYSRPYVAYGSGGYVNVAWTYTERLQSTFDDAIRYKRAANYAASSTDWSGSVWGLYSTADGVDQVTRDLESSASSATTVLFSSHWINSYLPRVWTSPDGGASWSYSYEASLPFANGVDAYVDPAGARVLALGYFDPVGGDPRELAMIEAPLSNPWSGWSSPESFSTGAGYANASLSVSVDPSHANRVAVGWQGYGNADYQASFDAEWRADPGYPNYDRGFPLTIPTGGRTAPAIVDVDADPYDEVVFGNLDGSVYVVGHDGVVAPGWPQDAGNIATKSPVAVGDLDGDGEPEIVAGNTQGQVYSWNAAGELQPGFPVDLGTAAATYVSIGKAGPFYPNWIVAISGNRIVRISYRGEVVAPTGTLAGVARAPAAVGDVDDDGDPEVVYAFNYVSGGSFVHVRDADFAGSTSAFRWFTSDPVGDGPSLGDLDGDGDLEICYPTAYGKVYALDHALADLPGFPFDTASSLPISQVALDQVLGSFEPELLFSAQAAKLYVMYANGTVQPGFPAATNPSWYLLGSPIAAPVLGANNWFVVGSRDSHGYAFRNVGAIQPGGWPRDFDDQIEVSAATGDIDLDGRNELVFLGNEALHVVDVATPPTAAGHLSWPMRGANPRRTSCMDCVEDQVTALPEQGITRLSFRVASQNPSDGPVHFAVELPEGGVLSIEIFDARGRRGGLFARTEIGPGFHVFDFDGKDGNGASLARGTYYARLGLDAGRGQRTLTRRFTLIDR